MDRSTLMVLIFTTVVLNGRVVFKNLSSELSYLMGVLIGVLWTAITLGGN